ncbi:MAG TPA: hypothetical protein VGO67_00955 [Verrucomicrobiae bacterium]
MKARYRLICRGIRGGAYYCVDTTTGKRTSLGTTNADDAQQIIEAKNNSERQPVLNLQIAKAYLAGSDNGITTRTWQGALEALIGTKQGRTSIDGKPPPRTRHSPYCCIRSLSKQRLRNF